MTLDEIEKTILPEFKDARLFLALGRGAIGSGRLRSEAYTADRLKQQLDSVQSEFVSDEQMIQIDRLANVVSVTPIFSWREAEFVAGYDPGATGTFAQRSPVERAIVAFVLPHVLRLEKELIQKNQFKSRVPSVRLAAERPVGTLVPEWTQQFRAGHPVRRCIDCQLLALALHGRRARDLKHHAQDMQLELTDKVAIITGSSRGLGLASAHALAAEGCRVCVCARGEERLSAAVKEVGESAGEPRRVLGGAGRCVHVPKASSTSSIGRSKRSAASTFSSTTWAGRPAPISSARATTNGRRPSTRRSSPRFELRGWPFLTSSAAAAEPS